MCLTNESKSPLVKPQYENGEIVCWVTGMIRSNGKIVSAYLRTEYKIGEEMPAIEEKNSVFSQADYSGRHAFLRRKDALANRNLYNTEDDPHCVVRAKVSPSNIIAFGGFMVIGEPTLALCLRAKAMLYQRVVK